MASGELETPLFIVDSQMDSNQLKALGVTATTVRGSGFAQRYAAAKRLAFWSLSPRFGLFSAFSTEHVLINKKVAWDSTTVGSTTLKAAIGAWYRDPCTAIPRVVELP